MKIRIQNIIVFICIFMLFTQSCSSENIDLTSTDETPSEDGIVQSVKPDSDDEGQEERLHTSNVINGFGMGSSTYIRVEDFANAYHELNSMGVTYIREEFPMEYCQYGIDQYTFTPGGKDLDRVVELADQNDLEIVALLTYGPDEPYASDEEFFDLWENYVFTFVERYGKDIHYWEIGNEMNSLEFWRKVRENATGVEVPIYAKMLESAYKIIKHADPMDIVILGGLINDTDFTGGYFPLEFVKELTTYSDNNNFDAIGLHTYWGANMPETYKPQKVLGEYLPFTMYDYVSDFAVKTAEINGQQIPIWITEVGYDDEWLEEITDDYNLSVDELQSAALARIYTSLLSIPQVEAVFWYTYENDGTGQKFSLKENSKQAFKTITDIMKNSTALGRYNIVDIDGNSIENTYEYRFALDDGDTVSIFWKNLPEHNSLNAKVVNLKEIPAYHYDFDSGLSVFSRIEEDGSTSFEITEIPKLLIGKMTSDTKLVIEGFGDVLGDSTIDYDEMVLIPAGEFQMGCDPAHNGGFECQQQALPLHTVYLDDYYIDKYEVTNAQYRACIEAGFCKDFFEIDYSNDLAYVNYPVIGIAFEDAQSYCSWAGKRLPTEAEWEKAARGTTVRAYPWGDETPNCNLANYGNYNEDPCSPKLGWWGSPASVGSHPEGVSPYGVHDMVGNVAEWVSDYYSINYYSASPYENPQGPAAEDSSQTCYLGGACKLQRVLRGGSNSSNIQSITTAYRDTLIEGGFSMYGIRCVSDLDSSSSNGDTQTTITSCPGAPPQRLEVGDIGKVCTKSDPIRLRESPGIEGETIAAIPKGTLFEVLEGPVCAGNDWSWWKVHLPDGQIGWLAEGGDEVDPYFLCPND